MEKVLGDERLSLCSLNLRLSRLTKAARRELAEWTGWEMQPFLLRRVFFYSTSCFKLAALRKPFGSCLAQWLQESISPWSLRECLAGIRPGSNVLRWLQTFSGLGPEDGDGGQLRTPGPYDRPQGSVLTPLLSRVELSLVHEWLLCNPTWL